MSAIQFGCPRCQATVEADSSLVGRETTCRACGSVVFVPPLPPPVATDPPLLPPGSAPVASGPPPIAGRRPPLPMPPHVAGTFAPIAGVAPPRSGISPPRAASIASGPPPIATAQPVHPGATAISAPQAVPFAQPIGVPVAPADVSTDRPPVETALAPTTAAPVTVPGRSQSLPYEGDRTHDRLSAEEKEHRRLRRNIITATLGVVLLLVLMTILMKIAG